MTDVERANSPRPRRILGRRFLETLADAGVITVGESVRRVVIDADVDGPVCLYVERYGDERLLSVATSLTGIEITEHVPAEVQS